METVAAWLGVERQEPGQGQNSNTGVRMTIGRKELALGKGKYFRDGV